MKYTSIKNWPEDERPRERLLRNGAGGLSSAELVAIILRTGYRDRSALELARTLLTHFNGIGELDDASVAEFSAVKGMGSAKIAQLKASLELGRRLLQGTAAGSRRETPFKNSLDVYDRYRIRFYGLKKERFLCAMLDTKNRVFKETIVSDGTLTSSLVHPREVFRCAIKEAAASVIFVHNHPSGDPNPSRDDIAITERLVKTGEIVGIQVLDHIIIGDGNYLSLMDKGYLRQQ